MTFTKKFATRAGGSGGLSTFENSRLLTIPKKLEKDIPAEKEEYSLCIGENVPQDIKEMFDTLFYNSDEEVKKVTIRHRDPNNVNQPDLVFHNAIVRLLRQILFCSFSFLQIEYELPFDQQESIDLSIDKESKTVIIERFNLYKPAQPNPFYDYLKAVSRTKQFELLEALKDKESNNSKEVIDFYKSTSFSKWIKKEDLNNNKNKSLEGPGIYILFDKDKKQIYVGESNNIKKRLIQHTKPEDYMNGFTHFRYTLINEEYVPLLFLIENAAIHDIASIFKIECCKNYIHPLASAEKGLFGDIKLKDLKLMNRVEHQTKKHKK